MAMFRNVMVYLGLGPDDEYDDGYYEDDTPHRRLERELERETMPPAVVTRPRAERSTAGTEAAVVRAGNAADQSGRHPADGIGMPSDAGMAKAPAIRSAGSGPDPFAEDHGGVGSVRPLRAVPDDPPPFPAEGDGFDPELEFSAESKFSPEPEFNSEPEFSPGRSAPEMADSVNGDIGGPPSAPAPAFDPSPHHQGRAVQEIPQPQRTKPVTVTPQSFGDAKHVADEFRAGVPVIMNLQGVDRDVARRLIDFASGICYCLDGSMEKAAPQVFLLTPASAEVSDDDRRRMEDRGYDR